MRISDWSSDVCSSDLVSYRDKTWLSVDNRDVLSQGAYTLVGLYGVWDSPQYSWQVRAGVRNLTDENYKTEGQEFASVGNIQTAYYGLPRNWYVRSEEHTSELQSLMRPSYAVFCLTNKQNYKP